jgi:hypothetical protein
MKLKIAAVLTLLALAGCASRTPVVYPPLNEAEYQPFTRTGAATVSGSAFLVTRGGDIKKAAARQVFLIPQTSFVSGRLTDNDDQYSTFEWLEFSGTDSTTIAKAWRHTKSTVADVDGKYSFTKVPSGKYVVETKLFWQYVSCGFFGCKNADTGAVLRSFIEVQDGATVDVQLTSVVSR